MKIRSEKPETPIKDRIRMFCASLNMTDRDFQAAANLGEGFMARQSEPVCTAIGNITRAFPKLSPDWLLTGSGPMLRSLREHPSVTSITAIVPDESSSEKYEATEESRLPSVEEPTQPYASIPRRRRTPIPIPDDDYISMPRSVFEQLTKQLENKDAQIATLLTKIPES